MQGTVALRLVAIFALAVVTQQAPQVRRESPLGVDRCGTRDRLQEEVLADNKRVSDHILRASKHLPDPSSPVGAPAVAVNGGTVGVYFHVVNQGTGILNQLGSFSVGTEHRRRCSAL